jgi:hypothetical protein
MSKSVPRAGGRRANAVRVPTPPVDGRSLLDRILDTPHLARVVPRLPAEVLHRVIEQCGLADCGELVALTTPDQLARVLDLDLWRAAPGRDEQFDATRFVVWLDVLMEAGPAVAAQKLAEIDVDLVIAGLAQHVRVFDRASVSRLPTDDEELDAAPRPSNGLRREVGGYLVVARDVESSDTITGALSLLEASHHDFFERVMRGCRSLSNTGHERDGLDNLAPAGDQVLFDLAVSRERRQEQQGYVTPAQARAFLQLSRQLPLGDAAAPAADPVARAYFHAIEWTPRADEPPLEAGSAQAFAAIVDVLVDAGVMAQPARALLEGEAGQATEAPRLARLQAHLRDARDRDPDVYLQRSQELAYLANTVAAGSSIQARPFTVQEASDAAAAICNLGLENWPRQWRSADDLVTVFQVGWKILHADVVMETAVQLISVLAGVRCDDRETRSGLTALRRELIRHCRDDAPWRAREALDVISTLDMPAWAALVALIAEYPVIHAAVRASAARGTRAVSASAFEFISENSQIAAVRDFMRSLPDALRP